MSRLRYCLPLLALRPRPITLGSGLLAVVLAAPALSTPPPWQDNLLWILRQTYADHAACLQALTEQHRQDQQAVAARTAYNQQQGDDSSRISLTTDGPKRLSDTSAEYLRYLSYANSWIDLEREVEITSGQIDNLHLRCDGPELRKEMMAPGPPPSPGYRRLEPHELRGTRSD